MQVRSGRHAFQCIGIDFNRGVLINQIEGKNEAEGTVFSHECADQTLHYAGLYSNPFPHNEFTVRLNLPSAQG
jgi:hypothetical protein